MSLPTVLGRLVGYIVYRLSMSNHIKTTRIHEHSAEEEKKNMCIPNISVTLNIRQYISPAIKLTLLSIKQLIKFILYLVDDGY